MFDYPCLPDSDNKSTMELHVKYENDKPNQMYISRTIIYAFMEIFIIESSRGNINKQ